MDNFKEAMGFLVRITFGILQIVGEFYDAKRRSDRRKKIYQQQDEIADLRLRVAELEVELRKKKE